ncbi:FecCD family ABC transporter permease [Marinobacter sp.]|uniref:FecCD family ABC transporter permease n=1 Tax=Marinobacter sp. TaxID=50741 RepID=UPI003A91D32D|tara:strand:+ start:80796 stop:81791 length:996 start_codon:yes stop_codon:yes gene_type:complete
MKNSRICLVSVGLLAMLSLLHLCLGARLITPNIVWSSLFDYTPKNYLHVIVINQRLPRLIVAVSIGAMLALSGYVLQKILRNDLVSPSTLGINSGAATFCVAAIYFWGGSDANLFWPALTGGICALIFSFIVANILGHQKGDQISLVLGGAMSTTLFSTASAFIISLDTDIFGNLLGWLVGDISIFDLQTLSLIWPAGMAAILILLLVIRPLDLMGLGSEQAAALGVDTRWLQWIGLGGAIVLSIIAVTVVGPIGFVGLVAPHMVKILIGETGLGPPLLCLISGAILVTAADIMARFMAAPRLLNVGSVLSLFGGVAFLIIIVVVFGRRKA